MSAAAATSTSSPAHGARQLLNFCDRFTLAPFPLPSSGTPCPGLSYKPQCYADTCRVGGDCVGPIRRCISVETTESRGVHFASGAAQSRNSARDNGLHSRGTAAFLQAGADMKPGAVEIFVMRERRSSRPRTPRPPGGETRSVCRADSGSVHPRPETPALCLCRGGEARGQSNPNDRSRQKARIASAPPTQGAWDAAVWAGADRSVRIESIGSSSRCSRVRSAGSTTTSAESSTRLRTSDAEKPIPVIGDGHSRPPSVSSSGPWRRPSLASWSMTASNANPDRSQRRRKALICRRAASFAASGSCASINNTSSRW